MMPRTQVLFYREGTEVPVLDWLGDQSAETQQKCDLALARLAEMGHELRRPEADYLGE